MASHAVGPDSVRANPISHNSRRQILRALAAAPVAALPVAAAAVGRVNTGDEAMNMHSTIATLGNECEEDAIAASKRIDGEFWSAHGKWKSVDAEWKQALSGNPDMQDDEFSMWGDKYRNAFDDMLAVNVTTLVALYMKMSLIEETPQTQFRETSLRRFDVVLYNLERFVKREIWPDCVR